MVEPFSIPVQILLVEDSASDASLFRNSLQSSQLLTHINWVEDGESAISFLQQQGNYAYCKQPDIIILDLNLPRIDGREVLAIIHKDPELRRIPLVVITTSNSAEDIRQSYDLSANCYIVKPVNPKDFLNAVKDIETFWLRRVALPRE